MSRRLVINWRWIGRRAQVWRCWHSWMVGDASGSKACRKCGTWRWFPGYWSGADR